MSSRGSIETEEKYPEELTRRVDKDDRKQQAPLLAELQARYRTSDYSSSSGTPEERLAHISRDVNAIFAEREKLAKEKQTKEDAAWWAEERAKSAKATKATVGATPSSTSILRSSGAQTPSGATPDRPVSTTKGIEREPKQDEFDTSTTRRVARTDQSDWGRAPAGSATTIGARSSKSEPRDSEVVDQLRDGAAEKRDEPSDTDERTLMRPVVKKQATIGQEDRRTMKELADAVPTQQNAVPTQQNADDHAFTPKELGASAGPGRIMTKYDTDSKGGSDTNQPLERVLTRTIEHTNRSAQDHWREAKEAVSGAKEEAKSKVSEKVGDAESAMSDAKSRLSDGAARVKETAGGWSDAAADRLSDAKDVVVEKADEVSTRIKETVDDVKTEAARAKDRVWSKEREVQDRVRTIADDTKEKGREMKQRAEFAGESVKEKGRELSSTLQQEVRDTTDDFLRSASDFYDRAKQGDKTRWWHRHDAKDRHLEVDSSPEGVHLRPTSEILKERANDGTRINLTPSSLQGLGGGTDLPPARLRPAPRDTDTVPPALRGLENSSPDLDISVLRHHPDSKRYSSRLEPIHVPSSLRGLESTGLASWRIDPRHVVEEEVVETVSQARQGAHGILYNIAHMFDRAPPPTMEDRLRLVDKRAEAMTIGSAPKLQATQWQPSQSESKSLTPTTTTSASLTPTSQLGWTPQWEADDILHDRSFRELLVETME